MNQMNPVHAVPPPVSLNPISILSFHPHLVLRIGCFPSVFHANILYAFLFYTTIPHALFHLIFLDLITLKFLPALKAQLNKQTTKLNLYVIQRQFWPVWLATEHSGRYLLVCLS
jgi:hypothetical protein